jgi:hypothetical protein
MAGFAAGCDPACKLTAGRDLAERMPATWPSMEEFFRELAAHVALATEVVGIIVVAVGATEAFIRTLGVIAPRGATHGRKRNPVARRIESAHRCALPGIGRDPWRLGATDRCECRDASSYC